MPVLITWKFDEDRIKSEGASVDTLFSPLWVIMEVYRKQPVLIQSAPKHDVAVPLPYRCYTWNLVEIGQLALHQLALQIFLFKSVDGRQTDDIVLLYYQLTLWAFHSGELKRS